MTWHLGIMCQSRSQILLCKNLPAIAIQLNLIPQISCANVRYGPGVTQEVGMDLANLKAKNVGVYTDKNLVKLPAIKTVLEALTTSKINFVVYDNVRVEPTDESLKVKGLK